MLTVSEAAHILGLSEGRTRALISSGKLKAEKRGRQWMVFERSVEERKAQGASAGRPRTSQNKQQGASLESERAYSLYAECKDELSSGGIVKLIKGAKTEEERCFYVAVMNFFMSRKCSELVSEGVY